MNSVGALVLSEHDHEAWATAFARGARPTRLPYGIDALAERGYALTSVHVASGRLGRKVRAVAEHRLGMPLERAVRGAFKAARADVVIALLEGQALAPAWAKRRGLPPYARRPLVVWSCWLADRLSRLEASERRALARTLASADLIAHLSATETQIFLDAGFSSEQLFAMTYGVASDFYTPTDAVRDIDVLAVGQDRGRDYRTLFRAVAGTDIAVEVVCKPENLVGLDVPPNVTVHGPVDHLAYRTLLRRAKVLAVPTHQLAYPTGSSVALEAASCGDCVVVTSTPAMRELFVDDENALLAEVGDADGFRSALSRALSDADLRTRLGTRARQRVAETFNARHMWFEIDDVLRARGILPAREEGDR